MTTIQTFEYTKLATAGYVDLTGATNFDSTRLRDLAFEQARMPAILGDQFFVTDAWRVVSDPRHPPTSSGTHNDPNTGFAATLFQRGTAGEKVLSIRGTEPSGNFSMDLLKADFAEIGTLGIAISQTISLFNLVQRMKAAPGETGVMQLTLRTRVGIPPIGKRYVSLSRTGSDHGNALIQ